MAVIIEGDLSINRQGMVNSAIERIKHLKQLGAFSIDVYCIQEYDWGLLRLLHKNKKTIKKSNYNIEGIPISVLYKRKYFIDLIFESRLQIMPLFSTYYYKRVASKLKKFDLIVGHSSKGGTIAYVTNEKYQVPYCVVWHGSDIHTHPVTNKYTKTITSKILFNAAVNIFVSKSLLNDAQNLFETIPNPHIAYNAPSEPFVRYDDIIRKQLRIKKGVEGKKVVAFVGNLVPAKNVFSLPGIFKMVKNGCDSVVFWVIGRGMYLQPLMQRIADMDLECKFWGNQQPEAMPEFMNCIDVLVLPSTNESFGMVLVEAIACGANAVGSKRGGIPEVIGDDNSFELDGNFEERISERILYMLNNHVVQSVNPVFNWYQTAKNEYLWYSDVLKASETQTIY